MIMASANDSTSSYANETTKSGFEDTNMLSQMMQALLIQSNNQLDSKGLLFGATDSVGDRHSPGDENFVNSFFNNGSFVNGLAMSNGGVSGQNLNHGFDNESGSFPDPSSQNIKNLQLQEQYAERIQQEKNFIKLRNRFYSCSSIDLFQDSLSVSPIATKLDEPVLPVTSIPYNFNRRHTSFGIPDHQLYNNCPLQFNNFSEGYFNEDQLLNSQIKSQGPEINCADQSCTIRYNNNNNKTNKSNLYKEQKCVMLQCNSCPMTGSVHKSCYDKKVKLNRRRNSYTPHSAKKQHQIEVHYNCSLCPNGLLRQVNLHQIPNPIPYAQHNNNNNNKQKRGSSEKFDLNNNVISQINYNKHGNKFPKQKNIQQSSKNYRKKSLSMATPLLSSLMQSVRESRSSSPTNYTALNIKRQSIPVIMPRNRYRTISIDSAGSYTPSSSFPSSFGGYSILGRKHSLQSIPNMPIIPSSNMLNISNTKLNLSDSNLEEKRAQSGNMFNCRQDWTILTKVPVSKQNSIHIRLDDEGPYGNDETRCFLLSHLSTLGIREISCVICRDQLNIYDRFPLLDGTLYCSPINYNYCKKQLETGTDTQGVELIISVETHISGETKYIYGVCLSCLHGSTDHEITCSSCQTPWRGGANLQIGTMYRYDIFAAFPCCITRQSCNKCGSIVAEADSDDLKYFSSYSEKVTCPQCRTIDFHFVKPLKTIFNSKKF